MKEDYQAVLDEAAIGKRIIPFPAAPAIFGLRILEALGLSPLYKWSMIRLGKFISKRFSTLRRCGQTKFAQLRSSEPSQGLPTKENVIEDGKENRFSPSTLNEFMVDDYRLRVVRTTSRPCQLYPRTCVKRSTSSQRLVRVPGFRNSLKAPAQLKVRPMAEAFEKNPELVAAILAAWAETQTELRIKVYTLLKARGWEVLPPEADRTVLPGFLTQWPKGETFEVLNAAFEQMYPGTEASSDDVSLMVVWLSGRLPYQFEDEEMKPGWSQKIHNLDWAYYGPHSAANQDGCYR
jgi:hypothetical protein